MSVGGVGSDGSGVGGREAPEAATDECSNNKTSADAVIGVESTKVAKRQVDCKVGQIKIKRSASLTKDEKTESNTKARERERGKPKRFAQRGDSGLKRRHTVGGTRDFDKVS